MVFQRSKGKRAEMKQRCSQSVLLRNMSRVSLCEGQDLSCVVMLVSDDSRHLTHCRFNALRRCALVALLSGKDELSPLLMCVEN